MNQLMAVNVSICCTSPEAVPSACVWGSVFSFLKYLLSLRPFCFPLRGNCLFTEFPLAVISTDVWKSTSGFGYGQRRVTEGRALIRRSS